MFNRNFEQQIRISDAMRRENAIAEDYWKSIINQQVQPTLHDIEQNFTFKIDQLVANVGKNEFCSEILFDLCRLVDIHRKNKSIWKVKFKNKMLIIIEIF